ncbi:MAG: CAP domain-containing protein [Methanoregula sp.]
MVQRVCGKCGTPSPSSSQKFCAACGAPLPDAPVPYGTTPSRVSLSGVPRWLLAVAVIAVVVLAGVVIITSVSPGASSTASAGSAGGQAGISPGGTDSIPLTGVTTVTTTLANTVTTTPTPGATTAVPSKTTTSGTTASPVSTTAPVATTAPPPATVTSEAPQDLPTSQITLAMTVVPPQPPASSYTSSTPGAPYLDPASLESRIHDLINVQRQQNGLMPLSYDSFLAGIARGHSWDMVTRQFFDHINPDGKNAKARGDAAGYPCIRSYKSYATIGIAENLFQTNRYRSYTTSYTTANETSGISNATTSYDWNSAETVAQTVVTGWMNSPGHRKNILTDTYYQEGIGISFSPDDKIYVTENFC